MNAWKFISDKHSASVKVVLLYVLKSKGSSPGRQGFKMAVAADGDFFGTIGGGIMEHKFVEMAKAQFTQHAPGADLYKQVHNKSVAKNQSGMICSGEQTIFLYHINESDLEHIRALNTSLANNQNGTLQLSRQGIFFSDRVPGSDYSFEQASEDFLYTEKTGYKNQLHIIGGGHCSLALSKMMRGMDFYIHVYDERDGLNTMEQNIFAHKKTIVKSYSCLHTMIHSGDNVFVVIMTIGYRSDDEALKALLGKSFRYTGMLGSKKKIEKLFSDYKKENVDENLLKNVYSPIGVQIKSQTAQEIAVSIAAEIIAVKNKNQ